jgi:DNA-binding MarR family transcriptional regulator
VTDTQLSALASLELAGAMTPRELADMERVRPPTMTKIVAKLEERGLVQRTPHPTDGRQVILAATTEGRTMVAQVDRAREAWGAARQADPRGAGNPAPGHRDSAPAVGGLSRSRLLRPV